MNSVYSKEKGLNNKSEAYYGFWVKNPFRICILNTNEIVHFMKELVPIVGRICLMEEWYDERETYN